MRLVKEKKIHKNVLQLKKKILNPWFDDCAAELENACLTM